jgi:hypothetical protein
MCPKEVRSDHLSRHMGTHIKDFFDATENSKLIEHLKNTQNPILRRGGAIPGILPKDNKDPKYKWLYCLVCKKGCFGCVKPSVPKQWHDDHIKSKCMSEFSKVSHLFDTEEIEDEEKPIEVNTELLEAQKIIEQLRTENAELRASINSLEMTKANATKASLPLLEVQEQDNGTETDSMALKAATKSISTLRNKKEDLEIKLENSYDNHRRTIACMMENVNRLDKEDSVRKAIRAFLVSVNIGDEDEEEA